MKVSVVTPTFNSEKTILSNLNSVINQDHKDVEHIIVDNHSTDSTLEIIKNCKKKNIKIYKKKSSIYEAMNYGIKKSKGDVISIIGSDDFFSNKTILKKVVEKFKNEKIDVYIGGVLYFKKNIDKIFRVYDSYNFNTKNFKRGLMPAHPATFIKKKVYQKYGLYNTRYKICSDFDFFLRILKKKLNINYTKNYIVLMKVGGVSTSGLKSYLTISKELIKIICKNNRNYIRQLIIYFRFIFKIKDFLFLQRKKFLVPLNFKKKLNFELDYKLINNINLAFKKKKFILSALNLAFFAYWYKYDYFNYEKNFILWPDGIFTKYKKLRQKKIAGRYLFKKLFLKKSIKRLFVIGNNNKKIRDYIMSNFHNTKIKFIQLPFSDIDCMFKLIPKVYTNDVIILTIPTPKQELLACKILKKYNTKIICIGGSLNMLSGNEKQVPKILEKLNLEFLWRLRYDTIRRILRLLETLYWFTRGTLAKEYKKFKIS